MFSRTLVRYCTAQWCNLSSHLNTHTKKARRFASSPLPSLNHCRRAIPFARFSSAAPSPVDSNNFGDVKLTKEAKEGSVAFPQDFYLFIYFIFSKL
jgi:hypothetical protein